MTNDVILNKAAIIKRCMQRINEEYQGDKEEFKKNFTKQDSIVLNLQRACEAAIDMAMHVVRVKRLGLPQNSSDVFVFLANTNIISKELGEHLKNMIGFRNIAIHEYTNLDENIIISILENHLKDFLELSKKLLTLPND